MTTKNPVIVVSLSQADYERLAKHCEAQSIDKTQFARLALHAAFPLADLHMQRGKKSKSDKPDPRKRKPESRRVIGLDKDMALLYALAIETLLTNVDSEMPEARALRRLVDLLKSGE